MEQPKSVSRKIVRLKDPNTKVEESEAVLEVTEPVEKPKIRRTFSAGGLNSLSRSVIEHSVVIDELKAQISRQNTIISKQEKDNEDAHDLLLDLKDQLDQVINS